MSRCVVGMTLLPLLLLLATSAAVVGAQSAVPVISSVSGCTNVGSVTYNCTFTSTVITVSGSNFPTGRSQQAYVQVGTDYTCNIALLTSTNITCTIFTEDPFAWPGPQLLNVSAVFPGSAQVSSAPFLGLSMQYPTLPVLQTITGCDDRNNSNGQFTQSCDPSFAVLTITGVGFNTIETARYVHLYLQGRVGGPHPRRQQPRAEHQQRHVHDHPAGRLLRAAAAAGSLRGRRRRAVHQRQRLPHQLPQRQLHTGAGPHRHERAGMQRRQRWAAGDGLRARPERDPAERRVVRHSHLGHGVRRSLRGVDQQRDVAAVPAGSGRRAGRRVVRPDGEHDGVQRRPVPVRPCRPPSASPQARCSTAACPA